MTNALIERSLVVSVDSDEGCATVVEQSGCVDLHRVQFSESYIDKGGRRLICHFRAPDAESVHLALRSAGIAIDTIWPGTIHDRTERTTGNIVIEREFASPLPKDVERALNLVESQILIPLGFQLVRAVISCDRLRVVCLCHGTNGDLLRVVQIPGKLPFDRIWPCRRLTAP